MQTDSSCASSDSVDISFVIVSWNARQYLEACLKSLRPAHQRRRCEIIVVDNASNDGSQEMIRDRYPKVKLVINHENTGFAFANNQGIQQALGKYLCLVNSDVEVFPETMELLFQYMECNPGIGLLGPKVLNTDRTLQPSCRTLPTLGSSFIRALALDTMFPKSRLFGQHFMTHWNYDDIREVDILSGCFWFIRRTALQQVGFLDTRFFMYGEDMDFCKRFHSAKWKVIFHPAIRIIHHGGRSSANAPARFWMEMQRANLKYWYKHHGYTSTLAYYGCLITHHFLRIVLLHLILLDFRKRTAQLAAKIDLNIFAFKWLVDWTTLKSVLTGRML